MPETERTQPGYDLKSLLVVSEKAYQKGIYKYFVLLINLVKFENIFFRKKNTQKLERLMKT